MIWANVLNAPNRWMANYLRRRGWVVFYLDKQSRMCQGARGFCWLYEYEESEAWDRVVSG